MKPSSTTIQEARTQPLIEFGYTPREARFLVKAALHSGYFMRRQYCKFSGTEVGGTAAALFEKLKSTQHGTTLDGCRNTQIVHLNSRPFYAAIEEEDNRNRRLRAPEVIKNKLMNLDFVLEFPNQTFLATEREKVSFFTEQLAIPLADLPSKMFRSPNATDYTTRYFVDKFPIALLENGSIQFCFVDESLTPGKRFEAYLTQYAALLARLQHFSVIYVATQEALFPFAARVFERVCNLPAHTHHTVNVERLLTYFRDRTAYAAGALQTFDRARLIRLRDDRATYSGQAFDLLFEAWNKGGDIAIREAVARQKPPVTTTKGQFKTHFLRERYDVFGITSIPTSAR